MASTLDTVVGALRRVFGLRRPEPLQRVAYLPVAGMMMTQDEAMNVSAVWACVRIISEMIASCEWQIYAPAPGAKRRDRLLDDDRLWLLNTRPNKEMTAIGFWESMLIQALAWGSSYAQIQRGTRTGRPQALWPLPVDRSRLRRTETGDLVLETHDAAGVTWRIPYEDVFHVHGPGIDGLMGDNRIARAARAIAMSAAMQRAGVDFYSRGAQLAGVLEYPGKVAPATIDQLRQQWEETYAGAGNHYRPLILEGGMKFTATTATASDSSTVEEKRFSVEEICRWFGVPPHLVQHQGGSSTYGSIEHASIEFVRGTLRPWAVRLMQECDFKMFGGYYGPVRQSVIDLRPLTMGDLASRANAYSSLRTAGLFTTNEIRAWEGEDSIGPDGDVLLVQSAMVTLDSVLSGAQQPENPEPSKEAA